MVATRVLSSVALIPTESRVIPAVPLLKASPFFRSYRKPAYGALVAGSSCRLNDHSKSCAVTGSPLVHLAPFRMWKVQTDPSAFDSQPSAISGTTFNSASNLPRPANSAASPWQYRSKLKSWLSASVGPGIGNRNRPVAGEVLGPEEAAAGACVGAAAGAAAGAVVGAAPALAGCVGCAGAAGAGGAAGPHAAAIAAIETPPAAAA